MSIQGNELKLEKSLELAREAVMKAGPLNKKGGYYQLMHKVVKHCKNAVSLANKLEKSCMSPVLIKINSSIVDELRVYNRYRKYHPGAMEKLTKKGTIILKKAEEYFKFYHLLNGQVQFGKSIPAYILLLSAVGLMLTSARSESFDQSKKDIMKDVKTGAEKGSVIKSRKETGSSEMLIASAILGSNESESVREAEKEKEEVIAEETSSEEAEDKTEGTNINTASAEDTEVVKAEEQAGTELGTESSEIAENVEETETVSSNEIVEPEVVESNPVESNPVEEKEDVPLKDYEIYKVKKGNTLWEIAKKSYRRFSNKHIYFYLNHLLGPMNNKGNLDDYKYNNRSKKNPHLIYPAQEVKVPDLAKANPNTIPKELKNIVGYDESSTLYTAKGVDGQIIIANPVKQKIIIISAEDLIIQS